MEHIYPGSLHGHTDYSNIRIRDCIIKIEDAFKQASQLGHTVLGFTDHECVSSFMKIQKAAKKYPNIKAILGNEIYLCRNGLNSSNFNRETDRYYHFILLAKDLEGVRQIFEISTRAWMRSYMARGMRRVPTYYQDLFDIIGANPGHVIGSTACLGGALPTQILRGTPDEKLLVWINQLKALFGEGNFYLEMQPSSNCEQIVVNKKLIELSARTGVPYIITTDSHYLTKPDRVIHKAYLNAQNGEREVDEFYATTYMMETRELESFFSYLTPSQLAEAYSNINKIKDSVSDIDLTKPLKIPELTWKQNVPQMSDSARSLLYEKIPWLKTFAESPHESDRQLVEAVLCGIEQHEDLQNDEAYNEINACLDDTWVSSEVNKARWSAYYLNLQNIINLCWEADSLVGAGRGSGVGFILLYCLDITQINPLREKTQTTRWRFLNPDRVSVLDIDFDIEGGRRSQILNKFREVYGDDRVANVATFRTEKSKSAILTAARGLGIDVDIAQHIANLIPADRGTLRTLEQCMYGDEENDWAPIKQFQEEMTQNYPEIWQVARRIEGVICGMGIHAGGVIFVDEPFTNSTGLMRAPDGTICTAFELHDSEAASLIKYDALSVEAMDKIHNCLDLLCDYGYVERKPTLKETYESVIGIYNLEREAPDMWKMIWEHKINSLFQMEQQSGITGIAALHPTSVDDLATLNSVIRLMAQEKGGEIPSEKLARFKAKPQLWDEEMDKWGLSESEKQLLHKQLDTSYGICESQEGFMTLVQTPECGGFNLTWADRLRKSIAKKNPAEFDVLTEEYYKNIKEKNLSYNLCNYVWKVLVAYSRGYGFNKSHTLAYSLIALQEMNLAYRFPIIFWNTACLISDSGGVELDEEDDDEDTTIESDEKYVNEMEEFTDDDNDDDVVDNYDEEDCDGYPATVVVMDSGKKKKKVKVSNYGKIAAAIGKIKSEGVDVSLPDINQSSYTFTPDVEHNRILHGLSGIVRISSSIIQEIIANRPYSSWNDLLNKVKLNKTQMVSLIKAGCFDCFAPRERVMSEYIESISDTKKDLNLRNMQMLMSYNLLPDDLDFECRVFNFNKYLKKFKQGEYYLLDDVAERFYSANFDMDVLQENPTGETLFRILQVKWDNIYKKCMDKVRAYIKANKEELLKKLNESLITEMKNKYALGTVSKWEMESISYYSSEHELDRARLFGYGVTDFNKLPTSPSVERLIPIKGKMVPIYKISRIAGTVLDRDKNKKTLVLLTTTGVVTVSVFGAIFAHYDKQLSEKDASGKKHVVDKSWFARGTKLIITGIRQENKFVAKKYKNTPYHLIEKIDSIADDGSVTVLGARAGEEEE